MHSFFATFQIFRNVMCFLKSKSRLVYDLLFIDLLYSILIFTRMLYAVVYEYMKGIILPTVSASESSDPSRLVTSRHVAVVWHIKATEGWCLPTIEGSERVSVAK